MSTPDQLVHVLAELEALTADQRALVIADAIGVFAGAHSLLTGDSTDQSIAFILKRMQEQAEKARLLLPVN